MTDEQIEEAARAVFVIMFPTDDWDDVDIASRLLCFDLAKAALAAAEAAAQETSDEY